MPQIIEINDLTQKELELYTYTSEIPLLRYYEPEPGIFIAESPKVIRRALAAGYQPISLLLEGRLITGEAQDIVARCSQVPIYTGDAETLSKLTGFKMTLGALCAMRRRKLPEVEAICSGKNRIAVLEDITNPTNVGAIFRSAAALGFDAVLLTQTCSDPLYRRCVRVSMGTVFQVPWTYFGCPDSHYVNLLKNMGFSTAAMALQELSVRIDNKQLMSEEKLAVLFGSEGTGLKQSTIDACDYVVKIPMAHNVDSLNVAAASAVAFWQLGIWSRDNA